MSWAASSLTMTAAFARLDSLAGMRETGEGMSNPPISPMLPKSPIDPRSGREPMSSEIWGNPATRAS